MPELPHWITSNELTDRARAALDFLNGADLCFLGLVVAFLVFLGSRTVAGQPAVRGWGLRLAVATFLLYGGYLWFAGTESPRPLWQLGARAGCAAGAVLALAWIVLPVLTFIHGHLRLALAVFLGYGAYELVTAGGYVPEQFPGLALRGLLASGLALVIAWILAPVLGFVRGLVPQRAVRAVPDTPALPLPAQTPHRSPYRPTTLVLPITEPETSARRESDAQRRREKARMQVELAYMQGMPSVGGWFPRKAFDDFIQRHLGDPLPPEDVEEAACQLESVLGKHQGGSPTPAEFGSLEELGHWLLDEQQRIQSLCVDPPLRQSQLLDLHQRYLLLATRVVQQQTVLPC
jgi:hypothetical protein